MADRYAKLPLAFEPNVGQTDARVKFLAHGSGYTLFLTDTAAARPANTVGDLRAAGGEYAGGARTIPLEGRTYRFEGCGCDGEVVGHW